MKQWITCLLILVLALPLGAMAEETTYTTDLAYDYAVMPFDAASVPAKVQEVMADSAFAKDAVMQGVLIREVFSANGQEHSWVSLMSLTHNGTRLLAAAWQDDSRRTHCTPVSETFLRESGEYKLTIRQEEAMAVPEFVIRYADAEYCVAPTVNDAWELQSYTLNRADGSTFLVENGRYSSTSLKVTDMDAAQREQVELVKYAHPLLLENLSADQLPDTLSAVQAMAAKAPSPVLGEDIAVASGVHLRQGASSSTKDLGLYNPGTLVRVEGRAPGRDADWVRVRIGDRVGWMSGVYVRDLTDATADTFTKYSLLPVCCADEALTLLTDASPTAAPGATVPAGTVMQVLTEYNGYLHVCTLNDSSCLTMSLDSTYGFVPAASVKQAGTPLQLKYQ